MYPQGARAEEDFDPFDTSINWQQNPLDGKLLPIQNDDPNALKMPLEKALLQSRPFLVPISEKNDIALDEPLSQPSSDNASDDAETILQEEPTLSPFLDQSDAELDDIFLQPLPENASDSAMQTTRDQGDQETDLIAQQVLPPPAATLAPGDQSEVAQSTLSRPSSPQDAPPTPPNAISAPTVPSAPPAVATPPPAAASTPEAPPTAPEAAPNTILINFNNVNIIEYIRFVSKISNKNFVFDEKDLQFNITIISEEQTSINNVMTALLQELRIHGLNMVEQNDNFVIFNTAENNGLSKIVPPGGSPGNADVITQVFRLNTLDADQVSGILRHLTSKQAIIEVLKDTNQLIITDLSANIAEIEQLIKSLDAPNSGLVLGQFVATNTSLDTLIQLAQRIMQPIAQDQILTFVAHPAANSIFVVSTPFMVERGISILQHLDQNQGTTHFFNLEDLKFQPSKAAPAAAVPEAPAATPATPSLPHLPSEGAWEQDAQGNWHYRLQPGLPANAPPQGRWVLDKDGNWHYLLGQPSGAEQENPPGNWQLSPEGVWIFQMPTGNQPVVIPKGESAIQPPPPEGVEGRWVQGPNGILVFQMAAEKPIVTETLTRGIKPPPTGLQQAGAERMQFLIHKLRYRKAENVIQAMHKVSTNLHGVTGSGPLVAAISSLQPLVHNNSLVVTAIPGVIDKVRELIEQIDVPLRQVFIELLIINTTLNDSLEYGVNFATRFGGMNIAGAEAFLTGTGSLNAALNTANIGMTPDASSLVNGGGGYHLGIIGRTISHNGTEFSSIGALVTAMHTNTSVNILQNPKIFAEDNTTAEIFVGQNTPFQTQFISNNAGAVLTSNFEFRDVGILFRVTPHISNDNIVTLEVQEQISSVSSINLSGVSNIPIAPTTNVSRTTTRFHVPDKYFLVISGMISDSDTRSRNQVPCLGGVPVLGGLFSDKQRTEAKNNLMLFIRPYIIDNEAELDNITKHEQDVFHDRSRFKKEWAYEVEEALDFLNLQRTAPYKED